MICRRFSIAAALLLAVVAPGTSLSDDAPWEPIAWSVELPDRWVPMAEHNVRRSRIASHDHANAEITGTEESDAVPVLYLESESGRFAADADRFDPRIHPPFEDARAALFDLVVSVVREQDIPFDQEMQTVQVGGVEFAALRMTLYADDGETPIADQWIIDGLVDDTVLTINYSCTAGDDCSDVEDALVNSVFLRH